MQEHEINKPSIQYINSKPIFGIDYDSDSIESMDDQQSQGKNNPWSNEKMSPF